MIADYIRGPGPRAGHLGRLKSSHVSNLFFSIKLKNKTFFFSIKGKGGPTPGRAHPHIGHGLDVAWGL
jgi:hypothetical protein